jgi:phosphoribosylformylglycinamidine synthase
MTARIYVTLKPGILDPQGQAVSATLGRLGFDEVVAVRVGKYIEVDLAGSDPAAARSRVTEMCETLLANTVIESYRFEIDPSPKADRNRGPLVGEIDPSPKADRDRGPLVGEIDPSPKADRDRGPLVGEIDPSPKADRDRGPLVGELDPKAG